jgi:putative glycosyltransferase (TIGR04372 family)
MPPNPSKGFELSQIPTFVDPVGRRPGIRPQNPFRIFTLALNRALGDFASIVCQAASQKARFDHAKLAVYFRNDRPYKLDILSVCPDIDEIVEMHDGDSLPLDVMDNGFGAPIPPPNRWYSTGWYSPHLLLTPSMSGYQTFGAFERTARFRFADTDVDAHETRLREAGVDPDNWFTVIHHREPSYQHRVAQPLRDVDPATFEAVSNWIIDTLGGQVVRIGHPEMTSFTKRSGFIDLASLGDIDFKHQLFAISRARFMLAGNSGPGICGSCFGTPTAMCNNPASFSVWNEQDAIMYNHIIAPDGQRISREVAEKREMYFPSALNHLRSLGYQVVTQSAQELTRLAALMHDRTLDTPKWREQWYTDDQAPRPNTLMSATDPIHRETIVEYPDLAPGTGTIRYK